MATIDSLLDFSREQHRVIQGLKKELKTERSRNTKLTNQVVKLELSNAKENN